MAFNMSDFFNAETKREVKSDWKPILVSVHKLRPAAGKENFYHMDDKEVVTLARTIELVGVQQYPVIKPIDGTDEYEVIAGHKRRLATLLLIEEGKPEYEMIPCKLENKKDEIKNRLILIFTNSTQRERNDYEKMQEIKEVRALLEEWQKSNELTGKKQNIIAEILGTNKTKIGTLENISKKLIPSFMEEFAAGKISTHAANEIAGLSEAEQQALFEQYKETGSLIAKDAIEKKNDAAAEDEQIEGQMNIVEFPDYLPDDMRAQVKEYAEQTGVTIEEAASILYNRTQRAQEPQKAQEIGQTTPEPEKEQETAEGEAQEPFMNEPETQITYNQPMPDTTDRKSLIINGKINMNKEYNGMAVNYFMEAFINSDLFGADNAEFWEEWKKCDREDLKNLHLCDYAGTNITYIVQTDQAEKCEAVLTDIGLEVTRLEAEQQACISYKDLAELIDVMIYTKVIEIKTVKGDLRYWAQNITKELFKHSNYLTENELYIVQDLMMNCKERAGN